MQVKEMNGPNLIIMGIRNIAKLISSHIFFSLKEPQIEFKNLSTENFVAELNKYKGRVREILLKKHARAIEKIGIKWTEISRTHNFLSDNDKILKYLVDNGWSEEIARSNLAWLVDKAFAIVHLHLSKQNQDLTIDELRERTKWQEVVISAILEEIECDNFSIISLSMNKGIRIYL